MRSNDSGKEYLALGMKILIIGDIVGRGGRKAIHTLLPELRKAHNCCFCIANGENIAGGSGLTEKSVLEMKNSGVDVITTGDHIWRRKEFVESIRHLPFVLRPANLHERQPGFGYGIFPIPIGGTICVVNLLGRVFMGTYSNCPFEVIDRIVAKVREKSKVICVDFHAEASSEKNAMGYHLDGRTTAVWGTHTHVATADERILEKGTAYITDIGMVGARKSVLGRDIKAVLSVFTTGLPGYMTVVERGDIVLHGIVLTFDPKTGRALAIERIEKVFEAEDFSMDKK